MLLAGVAYWIFSPTSKGGKEYSIVVLGDSVIGNVWSYPSVTEVMEERLETSVFNGGLGGTTMNNSNPSRRPSKVGANISMYELAQAICNGDWGGQKAAIAYADNYRETNTQVLNYFKERLENLSQIYFDSVEILIIEHGTNDYNKGTLLENANDPYDSQTFGGALRSSLRLLQESYPQMRIILVTPAYCELGENGINKCYNKDYGGGVMDDYVNLEKQIAQEFNIELIDVYHESGIWEDTAELYLEDRLHPSVEGRILLGNFISDYILENSY